MPKDPKLLHHFRIQSSADLDFVIGQEMGWVVGMQRQSPAEFRRRVLAAALSYQLQLRSIDYALKQYVEPDQYENDDLLLGDEISAYLNSAKAKLSDGLKALHTKNPSFGVFGAEFTLYRIPHVLDEARILANRGLLLEVLPILRLCLEMMAWAKMASVLGDDEKQVTSLKAQNCISQLKKSYQTAGRLYGYLSQFAHWGHIVHGNFLDFDEARVGVIYASVRYRTVTLALCVVLLDVMTVVINQIYGERSDPLVISLQGGLERNKTLRTYQYISKISTTSELSELKEIQSFLIGTIRAAAT